LISRWDREREREREAVAETKLQPTDRNGGVDQIVFVNRFCPQFRSEMHGFGNNHNNNSNQTQQKTVNTQNKNLNKREEFRPALDL
jgi:hypothetical protein